MKHNSFHFGLKGDHVNIYLLLLICRNNECLITILRLKLWRKLSKISTVFLNQCKRKAGKSFNGSICILWCLRRQLNSIIIIMTFMYRADDNGQRAPIEYDRNLAVWQREVQESQFSRLYRSYLILAITGGRGSHYLCPSPRKF